MPESPRDDRDPLDAPLGAAQPCDVYALARANAAALRSRFGQEPKTVLALYRAPEYMRWATEALAERTTSGTLEPASTALLEAGLSLIRSWRGVAAICKARRAVVSLGDARIMAWFNAFPIVTADPADTDDTRAFRLHVPVSLANKFSKLGRSLGMPISRLGTYALMAGALHAPGCTPPRYREAMFTTLLINDN